MSKNEIQELFDSFSDGCGYGDPDARRNAEQRLQVLLAKEQQKIASRLNWLTIFLVIVGLLNVLLLGIQIWSK